MLQNSATSWVLLAMLCLLPAARAQVTGDGILPAMNGLTGPVGVVPPFTFDILSFKPCGEVRHGALAPESGGDYLAYHCQTVLQLIYFAYDVPQHPFVLTGQPDWVGTDLYEFMGKVAGEDAAAFQKLDGAAKRMMMRAMLVDVLKLKLHADLTPHSVYDLVVGKGELKLTPYKKDETNTLPDGRTVVGRDQAMEPDGTTYYQGISMPQLAETIETRIGHQVINKTNLPGAYDLKVFMPGAHYSPNMDNGDDSPIPHIFDSVKALGLNLVSTKEVTGALVLDHVDRPPEN